MRLFQEFFKKNHLKIFLVVLIFSLFIYLALYFFIRSSDAFSRVASFCKEEKEISAVFGRVNKITLVPYGFYFNGNGLSGKAKLVVYIEGRKKSGTVLFF